MTYTEESRKKTEATRIEKYGSMEAYKAAMAARGRAGGSKTVPKGFAKNIELARSAGRVKKQAK